MNIIWELWRLCQWTCVFICSWSVPTSPLHTGCVWGRVDENRKSLTLLYKSLDQISRPEFLEFELYIFELRSLGSIPWGDESNVFYTNEGGERLYFMATSVGRGRDMCSLLKLFVLSQISQALAVRMGFVICSGQGAGSKTMCHFGTDLFKKLSTSFLVPFFPSEELWRPHFGCYISH